MNKILLDSNIIIALAKGRLSTSVLNEKDIMVSDISRLEVFGYHKLSKEEETLLNIFFTNVICIAITETIIDNAIQIRQEKSMSVGDAIIAATVSINRMPLYTANVKDFNHLKNLELINPLEV